ncbi:MULTISPECIES: hypothetical protein [Streptomyces]|uniref:Uncharacterized protein n=1 Tax=Streptomyces edwardsiae TaxID=3075527 RepID=A0ABU2QI69_9ACTN|nr:MULTISPECIES: hypothetical protein [unclassified Streptomyces]MDT0402720.1 hypothetical protein [Streptomyces sp. DSM 41635]
MNDVITNEPQSAESGQATAGHGKHRGSVSTRDAEASPRGRHRRPEQAGEYTESAA